MRVLNRNKRPIYLSNLTGHKVPELDAFGEPTAKLVPEWSDPEMFMANYGKTNGYSWLEPYGFHGDNDLLIIVERKDEFMFQEGTLVWIGIDPDRQPNYRVRRRSPHLNVTTISLERVQSG